MGRLSWFVVMFVVGVGVAAADDPEPFAEALPDSFEEHEQDPTIGDVVEQGSFVLPSVMKLESARMPVLVEIFPRYSPRNATTPWGRGWEAPYLSIRRTRVEGAPRFDAQDAFASGWGTLQTVGPQLFVRGFVEPVQGRFEGNKIVVVDERATTWTYDGTRYVGPRGIERWELTRVADVFGNAVALSYDANGNLTNARWTRQGLLAHRVVISYSTVATVGASEMVAGVERANKQRVDNVVISNTHRDTGAVVPVVTYRLKFEAPKREWLVTSVIEERGGQSRTTTYQYGTPWFATSERLTGKVVKSAATLPTYPTLPVPEHALASRSLAALDVSNDGGSDVMTKDGLWWIFDREKREYVRSSYLANPDPDCVDKDAPWPTLLRFRSGYEEPLLVRLVSKKKDSLELTQCSLPGKVVARTRLTIPRPPAIKGCEAIKPGPLERDGTWPYSLADLDADGTPDLTVADACRLLVWYGKRDGDKLALAGTADTVELAGLDPAIKNVVLDYNGDGLLDVIDYSREHRVWLNRGNLRDRKPAFAAPKTLRLDQTEGTAAGACRRYLLHVDTDRILDAMVVCQLLDDVGAPPGMAPFRFAFFLGDTERFRQVRYFEDARWTAGWPSTLTVAEHAGSGLTFIELLPTSRASADKPCPDGSLKGATRGPSGPQYWCSPLVYWMSLAPPSADLLTVVDNGRGDRTTFEYAWSTFPTKFGRGPVVLASRTHQVIGRDPVSSTYRYEEPWFEGRAHAFGGFRKITRTEQHGTTQNGAKAKMFTFTFAVQNNIAARMETQVQGSDGSVRGTTWEYDWKMRDGIPLVRMKRTTTTLTLGKTRSERTRTDYAYARDIDICPASRTWSLLVGAKMSASTTFEYQRPKDASTLACLESKRVVTGTHTDSTPRFIEQVKSAYTAKGQLTRRAAVSGTTEIVTQSATYAVDGNPTSAASGGTAAVKLTSYRELVGGNKHAPTSLVGKIDLPDGRAIEINYDPITDQPTVLRATRTDKTGRQYVRRVVRTTDAWSRLASEASDDGSGTPTAWRTFVYRDGSSSGAGALWTTNAATGERRMTVLDGRQRVIAELIATGTKGTKTTWRMESALLDNDKRNEIIQLVGGVVDLDAGAVPTAWQLMSSSATVVQRRTRAPGSLAGEALVPAPSSGLELVFKTTAALDPSGLLVFSRSDGTRTEYQRFDGANRLVSTTTFAGATRTAAYDALGRLRRLMLPGVIAGTDYDEWGRVAGTHHGDLAVSYTYVPGKPRVACEKTRGGALTLETCFTYNAIGQPTERRSSTNGRLDDVARWEYEPGFASPTAIEGPNYRVERTSDGVESFGEMRSTLRTTVFPLAETVQNPPRHDRTQVITFFDAVDHRADGSIAKLRTTIDRNGTPLPGGDLACTDTRDGFGATSQWSCGRFSITKATAFRSTSYTLSNGRTLEVVHTDERRNWDKLTSKQQSTHRWSMQRTKAAQGWTVGDTTPDGGMTGFDRFDDGALKEVKQWPKLPEVAESYLYDSLGLVASTLGQPIRRKAREISLGTRMWRLDELGRFTALDGATATWNAQSQITAATRGPRSARYVHDAIGQRLLRAETTNGATTWTFSHGRFQVRMAAAGQAAPQIRIPIELDGHIFAMLTESGARDVEYDPTNTLIVVDGKPSTGAAFGHRATHATDVPEYAGAYYDDLLGVFRFGVRDYVPELAQFSSPDPFVLRTPSMATDARSSNLYSYARANPHDFADPSGLTECQTTTEGCQSGSSASLEDEIEQLCAEYGGCPPPIDVDGREEPKWPWEDRHEDEPEETEGGYEPPEARDPQDPYRRGSDAFKVGAAGGVGTVVGKFVTDATKELVKGAFKEAIKSETISAWEVAGRAGVAGWGAGWAAGALAGFLIYGTVAAIEAAYVHNVNGVAANIHQVFLNPATPPRRK